ncbi:hypothetical protein V5O48_010325 [Marasmius crinis-equi]|uniref:Alpha/beta hydrolase fold-3 domain-containing protein n=1 Tax=Marasmius crinis-equi TaxID=585013 RepID=A0ABR3F8L9_9AGAR
MPRPRWALQMEAVMWRNLMDIGMRMHVMARPPAPGPDLVLRIPATVSPVKGEIEMFFWVPESYKKTYMGTDKGKSPVPSSKSTASSSSSSMSSDNSTSSDASSINTIPGTPAPSGRLYPFVINFHGGGFTIGRATDDARWARSVVAYVDAVVVSVDYRLAPEHPFPTAIEDGVDAALYLVERAEEFGLDKHRMAFSGFSAGGNMSFSVPIRLAEEYRKRAADPNSQHSKEKEGTVATIAAWYPSLDYTQTREERRKTNVRKDKDLPKFFTNLFDASYLHPPGGIDLASPWLSPSIAPDSMIRDLPQNIVLYTCEWDELQAEGEVFYRRLVDKFGKRVAWKKIRGVTHAFDKTPNPVKWDPKIEGLYRDACKQLRRVFYGEEWVGEEVSEEDDEIGKKADVETRIEVVEMPKEGKAEE